MDCSTPGLPVYHQLPEFIQTHVHWVSDTIQPSHLLSSPSPPAFILSQHHVFSNESVLCIRWPKYWSFSISPSNEYWGLVSFRMDWFGLLAVQGTLKSLLQHQSSKTSILWHSAFFIVQLSHPYLTTGKTIALTSWTFVGKVMSPLFNMLLGCCLGEGKAYPTPVFWPGEFHGGLKESDTTECCSLSLFTRLVIAFLPRSKRLLISWLQSPSAVIYGAQEN